MARFLETAHGPAETEIADTQYGPGEWSVRESKLEQDGLDHFLGQQANSKNEFGQELEPLIGVERARQFCEILSEA